MKKVIFISFSFVKGGAAKAANNIYDCLKRNKLNIKKYSFQNILDNNLLLFFKILLLNLFFRMFFFSKKKISFNLFNINSLNELNKDYDIFHFNWIGNEFISLKEIINLDKKIIWTVHDDWLKNIVTHVAKENDLNYFFLSNFKNKIFDLKKKLFKKKIIFVAPSNYILKNLKKITKNKIYLIRHPINEKIFKYKKKEVSNLLTFNIGGSNVFKDQNKGYENINYILNYSKKYIGKNYKFIFFGSNSYDFNFKKNKTIHFNKYLDSKKIANIFMNSDYTFVLSKIESFSLITVSHLCGCPVVCFDDKASELIDHKKTIYSEKKNINSIKIFLKWAKENQNFLIEKKYQLKLIKNFPTDRYHNNIKKFMKLSKKI